MLTSVWNGTKVSIHCRLDSSIQDVLSYEEVSGLLVVFIASVCQMCEELVKVSENDLPKHGIDCNRQTNVPVNLFVSLYLYWFIAVKEVLVLQVFVEIHL